MIMPRTLSIHILLAAAILAPISSIAQTSAKDSGNEIRSETARDTSDVQHLMDAYHDSVVTHNGARLANLFLLDGGAWLNVLTEETYARAKQKAPEAAKVRISN